MTDKARQQKADPKTNRLLAMLEPDDYDALMREAQVVTLKFRRRLYRQDELVGAVYFPLTCMVSLLVTIAGGHQKEVATVGNEGVVGALDLLQSTRATALTLSRARILSRSPRSSFRICSVSGGAPST